MVPSDQDNKVLSEETDTENDNPSKIMVPADPENKVLSEETDPENDCSDNKVLSEETDPENDCPSNIVVPADPDNKFNMNYIYVIVGCSVAAVVLMAILAVICCKWHKKPQATVHVKCSATSRKKKCIPKDNPNLAQSVPLYHFRRQKSNLLSMKSSSASMSASTSETENENKDNYTALLDLLE
jgi:hypothetical protein